MIPTQIISTYCWAKVKNTDFSLIFRVLTASRLSTFHPFSHRFSTLSSVCTWWAISFCRMGQSSATPNMENSSRTLSSLVSDAKTFSAMARISSLVSVGSEAGLVYTLATDGVSPSCQRAGPKREHTATDYKTCSGTSSLLDCFCLGDDTATEWDTDFD